MPAGIPNRDTIGQIGRTDAAMVAMLGAPADRGDGEMHLAGMRLRGRRDRIGAVLQRLQQRDEAFRIEDDGGVEVEQVERVPALEERIERFLVAIAQDVAQRLVTGARLDSGDKVLRRGADFHRA